MPNPSRYAQTFDFSAFQEHQPATPLPGVQVDIQLAAIETSTTEIRDALGDVRRSDGKLKNGIVTQDSLAVNLIADLNAASAASASAAAASATDAAESAFEAQASSDVAATAAGTLQSAIDVIEANGFILDWGRITEPAGQSLNYGRLS